MEKRKFEDSFRDAFQKAEVAPSEEVWTNIELDLERLESGKMRRRLLFFKLLAAASVVFAMVIGGVGYYVLYEQSSQRTAPDLIGGGAPQTEDVTVADAGTVTSDEGQEHGAHLQAEAPSERSNTLQQAVIADTGAQEITDNLKHEGKEGHLGKSQQPGEPDRSSYLADGLNTFTSVDQLVEGQDRTSDVLIFRDRPLPPLVRSRKPVIHFPKTKPDAVDLLLASIAMEEMKEKETKKFTQEKIWTSVGFSAGTFSNLNSGGGSVKAANFNTAGSLASNNYAAYNTVNNETKASGTAYAMGISMGGRLSKRWVLQGGLNYLSQVSAYTSDAVVTTDYQHFTTLSSAEVNRLSLDGSNARLVQTAPYSVNNNMQFLSIPLQAGYVILNRSFAIQVNGGVSTDLFLQNIATPESGSLEKATTGRGDDSPFRPVNFVGLAGAEFSYRIASRYRLSVNPGVRYPFNSIYKSEVGLEAVPVTFDVGLRFRYIF